MIQNIHQILIELQGISLWMAISFAILYLLRLVYLFLFTGRILFRKKKENETTTPVSLFYTVRNEGERLKENLVPVLSLNGSEFEVIVVNNCSQDNSFEVLGMLKGRSDRLKISTLYQEIRFSTKMAQNLALKAAKYDWVLPVPISYKEAKQDWLSGITNAINDKNSVVINYCTMNYKNSFVNFLCRIENFLSFSKSVGYIQNNLPFVYFEENVAFRKKKYFELGGHAFKINEPYADLELVINQFITKKETTVLFHPETSIKKTDELIWNDYLDILKKNLRIEKHLSSKLRIFLTVDDLTKLLFPVLTTVIYIFLFDLWPLITSLLFVMFVSRLFIIKIALNRLNERKIFISSLVYDLIIPYFKLFYRWFFNNRRHKMRWKMKV